MTPLVAGVLFLVAALAGIFGSMLGLGGGIIIIPALTLLFGVEIHNAAATSLLCVVATSTAATITYLRLRYTNLRLGLLLELPTTLGAISGGFIAFVAPRQALEALFALLLVYTAFAMWRDLANGARENGNGKQSTLSREPAQPLAPGSLDGSYFDLATGVQVSYQPSHVTTGMLASTGAGLISGMLGVGGGIIKVPVMRLRMGIPLKAATATSNFMIGITGATSVVLYFHKGLVDLPVTALCALGVLLGATLGSALATRLHTKYLQYLFIVVLVFTAIQMIGKALQRG